MTSTDPKQNQYQSDVHSMAPVGSLKIESLNSPAMKRVAWKFYELIVELFEALEIYDITTNYETIQKIIQIACSEKFITLRRSNWPICNFFMNLFADENAITCIKSDNKVPAGASMKQVYHYTQMILSGDFREFSSSTSLNQYITNTPPEYNLTRISALINLHYSECDELVSGKNVFDVQSQLTCVKSYYISESYNFSHLDFTFGDDTKRLVYDPMIHNINKRIIETNLSISPCSQVSSTNLQNL